MRHKLKHKLMRFCVIETLAIFYTFIVKSRDKMSQYTSNPRENTSSTLGGYFVF